jgi:hypothetical protein
MVFFWALVSGCASPVSQPLPSSDPPTSTPSPSPARTITPPPSRTPTFSFVFTGLTLSPDQIQTSILLALEGDPGCELPCWWGITPGQTPQEQALSLLTQIGFTPYFDAQRSLYTAVRLLSGPYEGLSIRYDIHLKHQVVGDIYVSGEGYGHRNAFYQVWKSISPVSIVEDFGTPSRVWIETYSSSGVCEGGSACTVRPYFLWLFYDEQGFLIIYSGIVDFEPTFTFCPTFDDTGNLDGSIKIYLKSLDDSTPLENFTGYTPARLEIPEDFTAATGRSLEEFSALYAQASQPICFRTSRDMWP